MEIVPDNFLQKYSVLKDTMTHEKLLSEITSCEIDIHNQLRRDNPYRESEKNLIFSEEQVRLERIATLDSLKIDFNNYKALANQTGSIIDERYWLSEIEGYVPIANDDETSEVVVFLDDEKALEDKIIFRMLLLKQWRKLLDQQVAKWELETARSIRQEMLTRLEEWLEKLQILSDTLNNLSIEPGLLFDLSQDNISLSDIEKLKKWVEYISENKGVQELCDMLGRLRQAEDARSQEQIIEVLTVNEYVPDINSREEIVGVHLGREIERALPQEIALLSDDDTSMLFDVKFVEGRLMCFEMEGIKISSHEIEKEQMLEVEEEEKLGPIIICVDISGSMQGSPETIAKAVTLFMATRAISQKRDCLLINFSTGIETLDLTGKMSFAKVIEFLKRSFHGGTDVTPALAYALKMMAKGNYKHADLLIISDFIMASLPEATYQAILEAKSNKNQFYSLSIGDLFLSERLQAIFDHEWVYNPDGSSIGTIQSVAKAF